MQTLDTVRAGSVFQLGERIGKSVELERGRIHPTQAENARRVKLSLDYLSDQLAPLRETDRQAIMAVFNHELHTLIAVCVIEATALRSATASPL